TSTAFVQDVTLTITTWNDVFIWNRLLQQVFFSLFSNPLRNIKIIQSVTSGISMAVKLNYHIWISQQICCNPVKYIVTIRCNIISHIWNYNSAQFIKISLLEYWSKTESGSGNFIQIHDISSKLPGVIIWFTHGYFKFLPFPSV